MGLTLEDVAAELLAVAPEEFVARRQARAKELRAEEPELAAQVAKLPKPVASAYLLNAFARQRTKELDALLDLGGELREAQEQRDGDRVRALTAEAHAAVRGALASVQQLAEEKGSRLTDEVAVEQTLRAAMADDGAAAALRAGLLVKPVAPAGFGEVDLTGAVAAVPPPAERPRRPRSGSAPELKADRTAERAREAALEAAREAVGALERAQARRDEAQGAWEAAAERHQAAREAIEQAEEQLRQARAEEREQAEAERAARTALDAAERPLKGLTDKAEQARKALET